MLTPGPAAEAEGTGGRSLVAWAALVLSLGALVCCVREPWLTRVNGTLGRELQAWTSGVNEQIISHLSKVREGTAVGSTCLDDRHDRSVRGFVQSSAAGPRGARF